MTDFETHPRGTAKELRLSRKLVAEMKQVGKQYGLGIFPQNVINTYNELIAFYGEQLADEEYKEWSQWDER